MEAIHAIGYLTDVPALGKGAVVGPHANVGAVLDAAAGNV